MKRLLEVFMKKELQKNNQKEKVINYMLNGKDMTIHLIVRLIKKTLYNNE